ncbi:HNH endonuclease [Streptomyces rectiverticillatus]|uniref:HNH endonuclease family protein n=1 Tax=Streptomyces rectiverticillatus TaxID=173860 RepID=UPI0015C3A2CA|nr:HNH endonuclease family protein [Streptomyces rectiverticillatus]QLE72442.1 HNH endonuclease [Streptomyces rectiverticillatus]
MRRYRRLGIAFAIAAAVIPAALPGTAARATPPPEPGTPQTGQQAGGHQHRAPLDFDENDCEGPAADEGDIYTRPPKTGNPPTGNPPATPPRRSLPLKWPRNLPDRKEAVRMLGELKVKPFSSTGYHRKHFGSACWVPHGIDRCTTRQIALKFQSVVPATLDGRCKVVGGRWHSEYDNRDMADPAHVDIDHVVPLRHAWGSGARTWTAKKRQEFANDLAASPQLIAVSTWANRRKGDKGPEKWMPVAGAECLYSQAWIGVKDYYGLSVTRKEKAKLQQVLAGCKK